MNQGPFKSIYSTSASIQGRSSQRCGHKPNAPHGLKDLIFVWSSLPMSRTLLPRSKSQNGYVVGCSVGDSTRISNLQCHPLDQNMWVSAGCACWLEFHWGLADGRHCSLQHVLEAERGSTREAPLIRGTPDFATARLQHFHAASACCLCWGPTGDSGDLLDVKLMI